MKPDDVSHFYDLFYTTWLTPADPHTRDAESFFKFMAERIVRDFSPKTVLDVGCSNGRLVAELRNLDVKAWGVDYPEGGDWQYRLSDSYYCRDAYLTDSFPRKYDLIVCLETLVDYPLDEAEEIIENICQHTKTVLFSSSPFFFKGADASSVRPPDDWAGEFAYYGFYRDLDYPTCTILPWIMRFYKEKVPNHHLVTAYERRIWQSSQENRTRRILGMEMRAELVAKELWWREALEAKKQELESITSELRCQLAGINIRLTETQAHLIETQNQLITTQNSLTNSQGELAALQNELADSQNQLAASKNELLVMQANLAGIKAQLDGTQNRLSEALRQLDEIHNTYSWKFMLLLQKIRLCFIPLGSRRERWMRAFLNTFRSRLGKLIH